MIKKASLRRILIASLALLLVVVALYIFPQNEVKVPSKTIYKKAATQAIYLIDKNEYVARTTINIDEKDKEKIAEELLNALINGTDKNKFLPNGFTSYIKEGTKINSIKIDNDLITIDFNQYLFDKNYDHDEKIIESIVYTLTEIEGIKRVSILINGTSLNKLPSSGKSIPNILTRDIGVNKKSSISDIKNTKNVTSYFISSYDGEKYYVPVTLTTSAENEKIEIIINELTGKDAIDNNLSTYISAGTELKNYEILEDEIMLEFNNVILNGFDQIDEEVMYGIALSIYDTYNIASVNFEVNNQKINAYTLKNS